MTTGLPRPGECRSCAEPIRWVRMPSGKAMPVNPMPLPRDDDRGDQVGTVAAHKIAGKLYGFVISAERAADRMADPLRFTPHWATCPTD